MNTLSVTFETIDSLNIDAIAIALVANRGQLSRALSLLDWRMCGLISHYIESGDITGARNELVLLPTLGRVAASRCFFFGFGDERSLESRIEEKIDWMRSSLQSALVESCAFIFPDYPSQVTLVAHELLQGNHSFKYHGIFANNSIN